VRGPVLLEGPDGGGKTTLAEAIAAAMGYHVAKNVAPEPGTTREQLLAYYRAQVMPGNVIDRAWPSEMVYGRRFRGEPLLEPKDAAWLTKVLVAEGGVMVLCVPPLDACLRAYRERKAAAVDDVPSESAMKRLAARDPEREEQLRAVHEDYRRVAQFSSGPHAYHYDRTRPRALEEMVATLKERLDP
jgi:cytidylate kinase